MSTAPTNAAPAADPADPSLAAQANGQAVANENGNTSQVNWDSEIQLVSSLAKLQELERKV